jgi:hypothetical protein
VYHRVLEPACQEVAIWIARATIARDTDRVSVDNAIDHPARAMAQRPENVFGKDRTGFGALGLRGRRCQGPLAPHNAAPTIAIILLSLVMTALPIDPSASCPMYSHGTYAARSSTLSTEKKATGAVARKPPSVNMPTTRTRKISNVVFWVLTVAISGPRT